MTQTPEQVADSLAEAREYIEENGWGQLQMVAEDGSVCAMGAIVMSAGAKQRLSGYQDPVVLPAVAALARASGSRSTLDCLEQGFAVGAVAGGNDHVARDQQQAPYMDAKAEYITRAECDPDA